MVIDDYCEEIEYILQFLREKCGLYHDNRLEAVVKAVQQFKRTLPQLAVAVEERTARPSCTTMQAAEYLGVETAVSARKFLKRAGMRPVKASRGGKRNKTEYDLSEILLKLPSGRFR
jgi:hypothetical protein